MAQEDPVSGWCEKLGRVQDFPAVAPAPLGLNDSLWGEGRVLCIAGCSVMFLTQVSLCDKEMPSHTAYTSPAEKKITVYFLML